MSEKEKELETVEIDGKVYEASMVTPSAYFDYVKGLKQKLNSEEYDKIVDTTLALLKKTQITGQTSMARQLTHQLELAIKELDAAKDGFDIFVNRKDIERYIADVEAKSIKIIELKNYEREIPNEALDRIDKAKKHFDELYIVFTDYSRKETKKVEKTRRDKDPIVFGAFHDKTEGSSNIYVEDRLFFVADWVDDKCELTLEELVRDIKNKQDKDIIYRISKPEDEVEIKNMLNSFTKPIEEVFEAEDEPMTFLEKIKSKFPKKSGKTTKRRITKS